MSETTVQPTSQASAREIALAQIESASGFEARSLPASIYHDQAVYDAEQDQIFAKEWYCVGRQEQFEEPGSFVTVEIAGEPVIVIKQDDGELKALSNVCRHRGAVLVSESAGRLSRMVCPFHAWTYLRDGSLLGAPYMEQAKGFDISNCTLPEFQLEIWLGFVFINLDADAEPLAPRLVGLSKLLEPYGFDQFHTIAGNLGSPEVWDTNWKNMTENGMESYHLFKAHAKTVELQRPTKMQEFVESGDGYHVHIMHLADALETPEPAPWQKKLTERQLRQSFVGCVYPNMVFVLTPSEASCLVPLPMSVGKTGMCGLLAVPEKFETEEGKNAHLQMLFEKNGDVIGEDKPLNMAVFRGTKSRYFGTSELSHLELPIFEFHEYLKAQLGESLW